MNLQIKTRLWTFNPRNLGFNGHNIGPMSKRKLIGRNDFAMRYIVRVGSHHACLGPRGCGQSYIGPVVYFIENRVCVAFVEYGQGENAIVNRLAQSFIDFGLEGLKCE